MKKKELNKYPKAFRMSLMRDILKSEKLTFQLFGKFRQDLLSDDFIDFNLLNEACDLLEEVSDDIAKAQSSVYYFERHLYVTNKDISRLKRKKQLILD